MLEATFPAMSRSARVAGALVAIVAVAACSSGEHRAPDSASAVRSIAPVTDTAAAHAPTAGRPAQAAVGTTSGMAMNGKPSTPTTGDPDHDFLRMMSDHHKGMILMAHMTKDRSEGGRVVADAKRLDTKQDGELDRMVSMLEQAYKDPYAPKVMPEHQAMADKLKATSPAEYDRAFYQAVVEHHTQAITMIDDYLPHAKSAAVKQMAEKMKADQGKEIAEFQRRVRLQ